MTDLTFLSCCCSALVRIAGERSTHWHVCEKCNKPCDAIRPEIIEEGLIFIDEYAEAFRTLADS
jgi:hypothetical protein